VKKEKERKGRKGEKKEDFSKDVLRKKPEKSAPGLKVLPHNQSEHCV